MEGTGLSKSLLFLKEEQELQAKVMCNSLEEGVGNNL